MSERNDKRIWDCINAMEALCSKDDLKNVDRGDMESTLGYVYDQLRELVG